MKDLQMISNHIASFYLGILLLFIAIDFTDLQVAQSAYRSISSCMCYMVIHTIADLFYDIGLIYKLYKNPHKFLLWGHFALMVICLVNLFTSILPAMYKFIE
jgi:hypothetical protein